MIAERNAAIERGYKNLFDYCMRRLGLSEGSVALRIQVANVSRRFPQILVALAESRLSLSVAGRLAPHLQEENVLTRCVTDGQPRSMSFENANLPANFANLIGRPHNGQIVIFPVLGAERVISVVYTDNGSHSRAIEDIELLELATAQVGVAFENELLRRQIERDQ